MASLASLSLLTCSPPQCLASRLNNWKPELLLVPSSSSQPPTNTARKSVSSSSRRPRLLRLPSFLAGGDGSSRMKLPSASSSPNSIEVIYRESQRVSVSHWQCRGKSVWDWDEKSRCFAFRFCACPILLRDAMHLSLCRSRQVVSMIGPSHAISSVGIHGYELVKPEAFTILVVGGSSSLAPVRV